MKEWLTLFYQELIENKPCVSPHEMTDDQLMNELMERGKDSSGSREDMLKRLLELDQSMFSINRHPERYLLFEN